MNKSQSESSKILDIFDGIQNLILQRFDKINDVFFIFLGINPNLLEESRKLMGEYRDATKNMDEFVYKKLNEIKSKNFQSSNNKMEIIDQIKKKISSDQ